MKKYYLKILYVLLLSLGMTPLAFAKDRNFKNLPWLGDLAVPQNQPLYLVSKGVFSDRKAAEQRQDFIRRLMKKTPPDGVDHSKLYQGLPANKYVVGMLFDTKERARWWMHYSYRNRSIPRGEIIPVKIIGETKLPYMPSAYRGLQKRLLAEAEVLDQVRLLADVQRLMKSQKLQFKFTDYPRNGDLRYEVEIMVERGRGQWVMVDFIMISALDGQITERYSQALGSPSLLVTR